MIHCFSRDNVLVKETGCSFLDKAKEVIGAELSEFRNLKGAEIFDLLSIVQKINSENSTIQLSDNDMKILRRIGMPI